MLHSVPAAISRSMRQVVLRHPNSMGVFVLRRSVPRQELDAEGNPQEFGGMATLGGMAVLRPEDEAELKYDELGEGRMLFVDGTPEAAEVNDAGTGLLTQNSRMCRVESMAGQTEDGYFDADSGDLIVADLGMGALMTYEVVTLSSRSHIPPYTRVLIVNPRDDLDYRDGAFPLADGIAEPVPEVEPPADSDVTGTPTDDGEPPVEPEPVPAPDPWANL